MKKTLLSISLCGLCSISSLAFAQNPESYLLDTKGYVVKTDTGLCVRTSSWKQGDTYQDCDVPTPIKRDVIIVQQEPTVTYQAPVIPTIEKETFSNEVLFGFDKYQLSENGKNVLIQLSNKYSQSHIQHLFIVGYTDQIGSDSYNQTLSAKRAKTVENFLLEQGLKVHHSHSEGRGETELKVSNDDCKNQNLITCLAPNRRVDVTITTVTRK